MAQTTIRETSINLQEGRFVGRLKLTPEHGPVGSEAALEGVGFPADTLLDIIWESYNGRWQIEQLDGHDWNEFRGAKYEPRWERLGQVRTDGQGAFNFVFEICEDYGGLHDIYVVNNNNKLNKAGFRMDVTATISPASGPAGTDITVLMQGINPAHPFEGWHQLYYDNHFVGCITAVTTKGTARFQIPATGDPGKHILAIEQAPYGLPFIQVDVSSYSYVKTFHLPFELTPGETIMPPPIQEQIEPERPATPPKTAQSGPLLWTDFAEIPSRSAFQLFGAGLPQSRELEIRWVDIAGDRVSEVLPGRFGTGFQELPHVLCKVLTDSKGAFQAHLVPQSVQGGAHPIEAWLDGRLLTRTYITIGRRVHPLRPKAGPVGTAITVEAEGVGWTEHENEVALTYDNSYVGYACGADMMGKILPKVYATGHAGYHFIDLYPTFRNAPEYSDGGDKPAFYRRPILTWRDHPHGFHFRHVFRLENP